MYENLKTLSPELQRYFRHLVDKLRAQETETMLEFIRESRQSLIGAANAFRLSVKIPAGHGDSVINIASDPWRPSSADSRATTPDAWRPTSANSCAITPDLWRTMSADSRSITPDPWRPTSNDAGFLSEPRTRSAARTPSDIQVIEMISRENSDVSLQQLQLGRGSPLAETQITIHNESARDEERPVIYREATQELIRCMRLASAKMENDRDRQAQKSRARIGNRKETKQRKDVYRMEQLFGEAHQAERKKTEEKTRQSELTMNSVEVKMQQK